MRTDAQKARSPYGTKAGNCADCKRAMWRGTGSLPNGEARCQPCRRARPAPTVGPKATRSCVVCAATFVLTYRGGKPRKTCGEPCSAVLRRRPHKSSPRPVRAGSCPGCGVPVLSRAANTHCESCRAAKRRATNRRKNVRRRRAAASCPTLTLEQLGARDRWRCHLCCKLVNQSLRSPHLMSPTVDHLIPVSEGGTDAPENIRLAHRTCNTRRGTRGVVQLLLVG